MAVDMDNPPVLDMHIKCVDSDLQLDVDTMMLDLLLDAAVRALHEDQRNQQSGHLAATEWTDSTERALSAVDTCLEIFQSHHSERQISPILQFRLSLLKFTTLFHRRLIPASTTPSDSQLQSLRTIHSARARRWRESIAPRDLDSFLPILAQSNELPLPAEHLQKCQAHVLDALSIPSSNMNFYGTKSCLSLLDLLPSFMELTAARSQLDTDWTISRRWMEQLAGEFMMQSTLEAYLCFGAKGGEVVDEAFAWGYSPMFLHDANERASEEADALAMFDGASLQESVEVKNVNGKRNSISVQLDSDSAHAGSENKKIRMEEIWEGERIVNMMFRADPAPEDLITMGEETQARAMESEIEGWQEVRSNYLKLLQPSEDSSLVNHLIHTAADYPIADFDAKIKSFLVQLWQSIDAPVLVQLEQGQLAGLSVEETDEFKRKVGLESWTKAPNTAST